MIAAVVVGSLLGTNVLPHCPPPPVAWHGGQTGCRRFLRRRDSLCLVLATADATGRPTSSPVYFANAAYRRAWGASRSGAAGSACGVS
jgi:hypothetical protein